MRVNLSTHLEKIIVVALAFVGCFVLVSTKTLASFKSEENSCTESYLPKDAIDNETDAATEFSQRDIEDGIKNDIEKLDSSEKKDFFIAAKEGSLEVVQNLVIKSPAILSEKTNEDGYTALHIAAYYGQENVVEYLFKESLNVNIDLLDKKYRDKYEGTILHSAANGGQLLVTKYLVKESKAKEIDLLGSKDKYGNTVLHRATYGDNRKTLAYLIEEKKELLDEVNDHKGTVMHTAAYGGTWNIAEFLFEAKEELLDQPDKSGAKPIHSAAKGGNSQVLNYFVSKKEGILKEKDGKHGWMSIHYAIQKGNVNVVKALIKIDGSLLNAVDNSGWTPLHVAAYYGHLPIADYLINQDEKLLDIRTTGYGNYAYKIALEIAKEHKMDKMVKYLEIEKSVYSIPYRSTATLDNLKNVVEEYTKCFFGNDDKTYKFYTDITMAFSKALSQDKPFEELKKQLGEDIKNLLNKRNELKIYAQDNLAPQIFLWNEKMIDKYEIDKSSDCLIWARICCWLRMPRSVESLEKYVCLIKEKFEVKK